MCHRSLRSPAHMYSTMLVLSASMLIVVLFILVHTRIHGSSMNTCALLHDRPSYRLPALWQYRANAAPANILTGSLTNKLPEVRCDVLQLWFTGDGFVCTEGQAKSSGQFVKAPGTFRSAMSHSYEPSVFQLPQCFAAAAAARCLSFVD